MGVVGGKRGEKKRAFDACRTKVYPPSLRSGVGWGGGLQSARRGEEERKMSWRDRIALALALALSPHLTPIPPMSRQDMQDEASLFGALR